MLDGVPRLFYQVVDSPIVTEHRLARARETDAARAPVDQRHAELLLERCDSLARLRAGDVQLRRGLFEAQCLGYLDEQQNVCSDHFGGALLLARDEAISTVETQNFRRPPQGTRRLRRLGLAVFDISLPPSRLANGIAVARPR